MRTWRPLAPPEDLMRESSGEEGFEKIVERVASIEKTLGIYDLSQFTPKA